MKRRTFLTTAVAAGGMAAFFPQEANSEKFFPKPGSKKKWGILFGSRYGSARDAAVWISEGTGAIAEVFDAREHPNLSHFDTIIVGSGIYNGQIDSFLEKYLARHASQFSSCIHALFVTCGMGDIPAAKVNIDALAECCGIAPPHYTKIFSGRITKRLLSPEDYKIEEEVFKRKNRPYEDFDLLQRKDCLQFGEDVLKSRSPE